MTSQPLFDMTIGGWLEKWAADEFRSVNGQLEFLITDALRKAGRLRNNNDENDENVN